MLANSRRWCVSMVWHHRQSTPAQAINYRRAQRASIHNYAVFSTWTTISSLPICTVCTVFGSKCAHSRAQHTHRCTDTLEHTQRLCIVIETTYNWTVNSAVSCLRQSIWRLWVCIEYIGDGFVYMENCLQRRLFVLHFRLLRCSHRFVCATHHCLVAACTQK